MRLTIRHLGAFVLFLFFNIALFGQTSLLLKEKIGDKYYGNLSYLKAIATYEDIIKEDSSNKRILPNLAYSYRKISDMQNAERVFGQLVRLDSSNAQYIYEYAQLLAISKKYDSAAIYFKKYSQLKPTDERGLAFNQSYINQSIFLNKDERLKVELMNFNSGQSDFSPAFYKKGLVFVSNRMVRKIIMRTFEWDQSAFLDLYYVRDTADIKKVKVDTVAGKSKRREIYYNDDDTHYTSNDSRTMGVIGHQYVDTSNLFATAAVKVEPFSKKIKSKYHEGPVTFSADQKTIIFTRNNYYKGRAKTSEDGVNRLKLYSATINDTIWTNVKPLNMNSNDYSVGHPTLAPGDTILYFVSDMPGGIGGSDIYRSYWKNNDWSKPENLGRPINTEGNELFPYIDKEGTLYFSSDGHPGLGGLDIFKYSLEYNKVENMGLPLNSNYDDFGIAFDETTKNGFFSSNRRRGVNDDDIYSVQLQKTTPYIIQIVDSITEELIVSSTLKVIDQMDEKEIALLNATGGKFTAKLWDKNLYGMDANAMGYIGKPNVQITANAKSPVITIRLMKIKDNCISEGVLLDKDTRLPVEGARVVITEKRTKDTVYNYVVGADGRYSFANLKLSKEYEIDVSKNGYFNKPAIQFGTTAIPCEAALQKDFEMEKIVLGKAIKIENIYFDLAKYFIRKDAAKELDKIVKLMQENPDIIIELSSHTDCRASFQYNMTLSDNRAKSSAEYIISKGISNTRITGKGYGETKLVNDCACEGKVIARVCSEEEHQANRRTEFQVTGFLSDKNTTILNDGKGATPSSVPLPPK